MKFEDLYSLIEEESKYGNILVPRRTEDRFERFIQEYIKNGSKGDLYLDNTPISKLPDNLKKVGGYLNLSDTLISKLPDNLSVERSLNLYGTPISKIPDNLSVGRHLFADDTLISELPNNLSVGDNLHLIGTPISKNYTEEEIRNMLKHVSGEIFM